MIFILNTAKVDDMTLINKIIIIKIKIIIIIIFRLNFLKNHFTTNVSLEKNYFKITKLNEALICEKISFYKFCLSQEGMTECTWFLVDKWCFIEIKKYVSDFKNSEKVKKPSFLKVYVNYPPWSRIGTARVNIEYSLYSIQFSESIKTNSECK